MIFCVDISGKRNQNIGKKNFDLIFWKFPTLAQYICTNKDLKCWGSKK